MASEDLKVSLAEDQENYLSIAEKAAKTSGEYLRKKMNSDIQVVRQLERDVKLEVDYHSESLIINSLKQESDFPILTEERGLVKESHAIEHQDYQWIVDPLDGSLNYSRNIPICCVSIALWKNGEPSVGVVYDFNTNEIFSGVVSKGTWLNGKPVKTTNTNVKSKAVLATGFPVGTNFSRDALMGFVEDVMEYKKVRLLGSAALSLAYVACGRVDAYKEDDIKIWDVAAGLALIKAAGGVISYISSSDSYAFNVSGASGNSLL
jgi:myo-inositol-1(or 4)-monophosphatase